jgi:hypothetical protein
MAISGLKESLRAHADVSKEYFRRITDIEREIRVMVDNEIAAAIGILNGMLNSPSVLKYRTDICEGILVTITETLRPETSGSSFRGLLDEDEADRIRIFLMKEIGERLNLSSEFHVLVQIESCLITQYRH